MDMAKVRAIADVGAVVTAAIHRSESPQSVVEPLRAIARFDAMMVAVRNPLTGAHSPLLNDGYEPRLLDFLHRDYLACESYDKAMTTGLPMRMQDFGSWFYTTRVYQEHLDGAGYREGMTLVLRSRTQNRVTGLLTVSFEDARAADDDTRTALELVAPSLGQLVDVGLAGGWLATVMGSDGSPFLVDESGTAVPASPDAASEPVSETVHAVNRSFLASGRESARGYCLDGRAGGWQRVHLLRLPAGKRAEPVRALLLVTSEPLPHQLTDRELDVLTLVARGWSNRDVAEVLRTSPRTVGTHVEHLLAKTLRTSRAGLASLAVGEGLVRLELDLGPARHEPTAGQTGGRVTPKPATASRSRT